MAKQNRRGCPDFLAPMKNKVRVSVKLSCCGQHAMLDDEAEFTHRIVMQCLFRNVCISGHNSFYVPKFFSRGGRVGRCVFSTLQSAHPHHPALKCNLTGQTHSLSRLLGPHEKQSASVSEAVLLWPTCNA